MEMFEQQQAIVTKLLADNPQFRTLHERHSKLKAKVSDAERGYAAADNGQLGSIKKEKLLTKDKMAEMIAAYERENPALSSAP